jgi:hypothetical protein
MPQKEHKLVGPDQARLEKIESTIEDDVLAIARVHMFSGVSGSLNINSGRSSLPTFALSLLNNRAVARRSYPTPRLNT